jgi:hypothetical protein
MNVWLNNEHVLNSIFCVLQGSSQNSWNSGKSDKPVTTTVKRGRFSVVTHTDDTTPVMPQILGNKASIMPQDLDNRIYTVTPVSDKIFLATSPVPVNRFSTVAPLSTRPPLLDNRTPASPPVFDNGEWC